MLAIVGGSVTFCTGSLLPEQLQAYEQAVAEVEWTTREWVILGVGIGFLILALIATIGLFVFWRPARPLYLWTVIVGVVLAPLFGPYVDAGWGQVFDEAAMIVSGVILALIYYSPLRELYERPRSAGLQ